MTSNSGLRTELLSSVLKGTALNSNGALANPAFAVSYDTANGTPLQGVGR